MRQHGPDDWQRVAVEKLVRVMGERSGQELVRSVNHELGIESIRSADDLRRFAAALATKGGFAAAVGGLLAVHVAMYENAAP